jgi:undecaprenyl-diphosphatase
LTPAKGRGRETSTLLAVFFTAVAILGFLFIASQVAKGHRLALDNWLLVQMRSQADLQVAVGPQWLTRAMIDFTALGGGPVLTLVSLLSAGYLVARRKAALAAFLTSSVAAGGAVNAYLKAVFVRDRPDVVPHLVEVSSASFPSGHAMNSAMVYLTLAALLISAERSRRVRAFLMAVAVLLTLLVGLSRMYLGVHWPSDVLAGWAVGGAWATGSAMVAGVLRRRMAK